jgi:hypothetical protein
VQLKQLQNQTLLERRFRSPEAAQIEEAIKQESEFFAEREF